VLLAGLGIFAAGCLLSAVAPNVSILLGGPIVRGLGAALVMRATLSLLLQVPRQHASRRPSPDGQRRPALRAPSATRRQPGPAVAALARIVPGHRASRAPPGRREKLKSRLGSVKHAGSSEVVDGMARTGMLGREKQPLRPTRHPIIDTAAHALLLDRIRAAATGEGPLDGRTAALLALAGPRQMLEVVAPARADRP